jgi:hypothetical protein
MTEQEWQNSADPIAMLAHLRFLVEERQGRLFACACCNLLPLKDPRHVRAKEVALRLADGVASREEILAARAAVRESEADWADGCYEHAFRVAVVEAISPECGVLEVLGWRHPYRTTTLAEGLPGRDGRILRKRTGVQQATLLRCILGNPFRSRWTPSPDLLAWQGGIVPALAGAIYHDQSFDQLPILADALEEAGCTDQSILDHLRQPRPHVRGCWPLDLLLARS